MLSQDKQTNQSTKGRNPRWAPLNEKKHNKNGAVGSSMLQLYMFPGHPPFEESHGYTFWQALALPYLPAPSLGF